MRQKNIPILAIVALFSLMLYSTPKVHAQCKIFVRNSCLPHLQPYIHDGGYQAVMMSPGEEAEVYKTIFAGQHYRLHICIDNQLPGVEFIVSDIRRNILFDNRKNENVRFWDFKPEASQQIKVTIRIPKPQGLNEEIYGCVGMLFGLLDR